MSKGFRASTTREVDAIYFDKNMIVIPWLTWYSNPLLERIEALIELRRSIFSKCLSCDLQHQNSENSVIPRSKIRSTDMAPIDNESTYH